MLFQGNHKSADPSSVVLSTYKHTPLYLREVAVEIQQIERNRKLLVPVGDPALGQIVG
jgi:hypothetical protein